MSSSVFRQFTFTLLALILTIALANVTAMADCRAQHNQATELLDNYLQKAKSAQKTSPENKPPDPDAFEAEFRPLVDKLQEEKCLPELMLLIQRIQSEQQKYPHSEKPLKPAPIVD